MNAYRWLLLSAFVAVWLWAAIDPVHPDDWLLENYLVFVFVPIIILSGRYFRLSDLSYTFIALFMMMHVIGSHYTYSETPFGYVLEDWFGAERNMYDRFVHFCFGLLIAYPMREVFMRLARTTGFWSYHFPLDLIIAASAVYELIEWRVAERVDITAGIAFLGAQGDIWDAQKDMALALGGALVAAAFEWRRFRIRSQHAVVRRVGLASSAPSIQPVRPRPDAPFDSRSSSASLRIRSG